MSVEIARVALRVRCGRDGGERATALARDVRAALPEAFAAAVAERPERGIVVVPRVRVTAGAALRRVRGRDIARALAGSCVEATAARSMTIAAAHTDEGMAQRAVEALHAGDGVRFASAAEEGAAWLVALVTDDATLVRLLSPFGDLAHRTSAAAFATVCERTRDAPAVMRALGRRWAQLFAQRCSEREALGVLRALCASGEATVPAADAWAFVTQRARDASLAQLAPATRALVAAVDGVFDGIAGTAGAALELARVPAPRDAAAADAAAASDLTGLWLLLPYVPYAGARERDARALAYAVCEFLGGANAGDDPAVAALCAPGESLRDLAAALPDGAQPARLAVAAVRAFAARLRHFEHARCGYVLRAILSGPGTVRRTTGGAAATLPQSPLRIVLQRAALLGELDVPWTSPALALVRDDG